MPAGRHWPWQHRPRDWQEAISHSSNETETVSPLQGLTGLRKHCGEKRREHDGPKPKLWSQTGQYDLKVAPNCHTVRDNPANSPHSRMAQGRCSSITYRPPASELVHVGTPVASLLEMGWEGPSQSKLGTRPCPEGHLTDLGICPKSNGYC